MSNSCIVYPILEDLVLILFRTRSSLPLLVRTDNAWSSGSLFGHFFQFPRCLVHAQTFGMHMYVSGFYNVGLGGTEFIGIFQSKSRNRLNGSTYGVMNSGSRKCSAGQSSLLNPNCVDGAPDPSRSA